MKKLWLSVILLSFLYCAKPHSTGQIHGSLLGGNGQPLRQADVQLLSNDPTADPTLIVRTFSADADGRYAIPITHAGYYTLRYCGVDHQAVQIPVYVERVKDIALDVQLKAIRLKEMMGPVMVIGDFNNFSMDRGTVEMAPREGGYTAQIAPIGDTLAYQILGVDQADHSINGHQADWFRVDEAGDYISVLAVKGLKAVTVKYDLSLKNESRTVQKTIFRESHSTQEAFVAITTDIEQRKQRLTRALGEYIAKGGDPALFKLDSSNDLADLDRLWESEKDEEIRKIRYWAKTDFSEMDSLKALAALEQIPCTSPFWSITPTLLNKIALQVKDERIILKYLRALILQHPDSGIKPFFLEPALSMAQANGERDILRELYDYFEKNLAASPRAQAIRSQFSSQRKIQIAHPAPEFAFVSIDHASERISNKSMLGKIYLLDFWATWCEPCVKEMVFLHAAHEQYGRKGLAIISVSLDRNLEDVVKFRKGRWRMPWFNAYEKYAKDSRLVQDFELTLIPKPILVDASGLILATGKEIRGENLAKTLAKYFK